MYHVDIHTSTLLAKGKKLGPVFVSGSIVFLSSLREKLLIGVEVQNFTSLCCCMSRRIEENRVR